MNEPTDACKEVLRTIDRYFDGAPTAEKKAALDRAFEHITVSRRPGEQTIVCQSCWLHYWNKHRQARDVVFDPPSSNP